MNPILNINPGYSFSKRSIFFLKILTYVRVALAFILPIITLLFSRRNLSQCNHNSGWSFAFVNPTFTLRQLKEGQFFIQTYKNSRAIATAPSTTGIFQCFVGLRNAYKGKGFFHLPPLIMMMFQPFFYISEVVSRSVLISTIFQATKVTLTNAQILLCIQEIMFGFLLILNDFAVSTLLMRVAHKVYLLRQGTQTNNRIGHRAMEKPHELIGAHHKDVGRALLGQMRSFESFEKEMELHMEGRIRPENGYLFGIPTFTNDINLNQHLPNIDKDGEHSVEKMNDSSETDGQNAQSCATEENIQDKENKQAPNTIIKDRTILSFDVVPCCLFFAYYCNPITIASSTIFFSFHGVLHLVFLASLHQAYNGNAPLATLFLAIWNSFDILFPMVHLIPIILLVSRTHNIRKSVIGCLGFFFLWSLFLFQISTLLLESDDEELRKDSLVFQSSWRDLSHPYKTIIGYSDLYPNLGMLWYFFVQMFYRFRDFYVVLFNGLPLLFLFPISLRLWRYPLEVSIIMLFIVILFGASLNLQNTVFILITLLLSPQAIARMNLRRLLVSVLALVVPVSLFIMDCWLWLDAGTGNANYLYFQCLAFTSFLGSLLLEFLFSNVKRDKALRLTVDKFQLLI